MKKILTYGILGLFALGMVVAGMAYYEIFSVNVTVAPSIELSGECESPQFLDKISSWREEFVIPGEACTITNNAGSDRIISLSTIVYDDGIEVVDEVIVSYESTLELTKKDLDDWSYDEFSDKKNVTYTIVNGEFVALSIPDNYTLVYYPELGDWNLNIAGVKVIGVGDHVDFVEELGDEYCTNTHNYGVGEGQCTGAKLWLIPEGVEDTIDILKNWDANAGDFYFETSLIPLSSTGEITLSSGASLVIKPIYTIMPYESGDYTIETKIL